MDCCVNFGRKICTTPTARCCEKDFTHIGQPTAKNTAYIPSTGLFEVGYKEYFPSIIEPDSEADITFARFYTAVKIVVNSLEH